MLIDLTMALANGEQWMGFQCKPARVLYINMEIARASCIDRFRQVINASMYKSADNVDIWNLRGRSSPLSELAPKLIRRISDREYSVIIIDPIYKVLTGDENSNSEMALFCNFLDMIAHQTGCSVIFASHYSKGAQGHKAAIDRVAGAGVFGRDPDAIVNLTELDSGDGYRVETTLREFKSADPRSVRFDYPIFRLDTSLDEESIAGAGGRPKKVDTSDFGQMFHAMNLGDEVHIRDISEALEVSEKTARRMASKAGFDVKNGVVFEVSE
jgi:hypothetical protein